MELELDEVLSCTEEELDGFLCINRTFKDLPEYTEDYSDILSHYFDIVDDEVDNTARRKLKAVLSRLKNKMVHDCFVEEKVTWKADGVTRSSKEHLKYLTHVADKVRKTLSGAIQKIIDSRNEQNLKVPHPGRYHNISG